jgi:hypothetical protein
MFPAIVGKVGARTLRSELVRGNPEEIFGDSGQQFHACHHSYSLTTHSNREDPSIGLRLRYPHLLVITFVYF